MLNFFWEGLLHPWGMPSHLMLLIALGLLAGQQGIRHVKTVTPLFLLAIFCSVGLTLLVGDGGADCAALETAGLVINGAGSSYGFGCRAGFRCTAYSRFAWY